jgi:hypothetical protein
LKPGQDIPVPFFEGMQLIQDGLVEGIHEREKTVVPSEISAVIKDVSDLRRIHNELGRLIEPMIFDLLDLEGAVAGKLREPSDRIALLDPKLKPREFIALSDIPALPNEAPLAGPAPETLFMASRKSIVIDIA